MAKKINDLFGSMRWTMPEQRQGIQQWTEERGLVERPVIDEIDFAENCFRIYDSTQYDYSINVKWFVPLKRQLGKYESAWGIVREIDTNRKQFKLVSDWESHWIKIEDLISVTK